MKIDKRGAGEELSRAWGEILKITGGYEYRSYRRYHGSHAAMALFGKSEP